jgi:hypothetical protein
MFPVTNIPILSSSECRCHVGVLDANRALWLDRRKATKPDSCSGGFWTFGRASYIDVCGPGQTGEAYFRNLTTNNERLDALFHDLLEKVRVRIGEHLGGNVKFDPSLACPGFHIFVGASIDHSSQASAHFDLQYRMLPTGGDVQGALSFTLPLELPANGGGLECWNIFHEHVRDREKRGIVEDLWRYQARAVRFIHPYTVGELALQIGHILHRSAYRGPSTTQDRRITLQGHGLKRNGVWSLYW